MLAVQLAVGQPSTREQLNSERIAAQFGSYGVEVLASEERTRVSSLFSTDATGSRICRTFAVVRYPQQLDPAVAEQHAAILAGGSIGATFQDAGWTVRKSHLFYGELSASARLAEFMGIAPGQRLAQHAYVLDVTKDGRTVEYAAIVEIHHPDYLTTQALRELYGEADAGERDGLLADLLATAAMRVER